MPAGDLLVALYQLELEGVLLGPGTTYQINKVTGLGVPDAKSADVELFHTHGSYSGPDYRSARVITVDGWIDGAWDPPGGDVAAAAMMALQDLKQAWLERTDGVDVELHGTLPGWDHWFAAGRPRGLVEDLGRVSIGVIPFLGTFVGLTSSLTIGLDFGL